MLISLTACWYGDMVSASLLNLSPLVIDAFLNLQWLPSEVLQVVFYPNAGIFSALQVSMHAATTQR